METVQASPGASSRRIATVPNILSFARLATVPFFLWLFLDGNENAAVILFAAGAWTDFLDGYIARRFGQVSELGKLLDPFADRVFIIALAIALVGRDVLPLWLALVVIARDLLVLSFFPVLEKRGVQRITVNRAGKLATAFLLFGLTWLAFDQTTYSWADVGTEVGIGAVAIGALLYWIAGGMYAREALAGWRAVV